MTVSENNLTPGEMLIAAREKANLSLEEVAESTRIAANMLRAIELDEYHKVSGDLYVKSFLRSYAQAVDLEAEELINLYLVYTGATSTDTGGNQPAGWDEQDVKITKVGLPWGWIALAVLVLGGGFFFYSWFSGRDSAEPVAKIETNKMSETPVQENPISAAVLDSAADYSAVQETLSLGWQLEKVAEPAAELQVPSTPPDSGKVHLPEAFTGDPQMIFSDGRSWTYIVRLISEKPGDFAVKRDAEPAFEAADFPGSLAEAKPLPLANVVAGRAYAVRRGFVVYWGAEDHLSLRMGHVQGVEVSFNGVIQNVARFRDGEEILLDSSRLAEPLGN